MTGWRSGVAASAAGEGGWGAGMVANVTGADPVDVRAHRRRWYALVLLCAAFSMVILDSTIVYVALPSIQHALGFSAAGVQWVITVYLLTFAGLLLLGGRTADLVGRRTVFMVGVALFTLASLGCALAPSAGVLLAARAGQGVAAAMLTPAALALLITTFVEEAERNRALGIWGAIGGVGATAGLLVGGPITDGLGWEWIFLINVPVGLVLLAASPVLLRDSRQQPRQRAYDPAGAVTITAGLVVFVYAIVEAPATGWAQARTIGLLVAAAALIMLFVLVESGAPVPLVRLGIFRSPVLAGGNLLIVTMGMTVDAVLFTLTLYTQEVLHYSAVGFGLMMAAMTAVSVVGSYAGQALVTGVGVQRVAVVGTALVGVGCLLLTRISVHASFLADLLPALVVFGLGLGGAFVAANVAALSGVAEQESGVASGVANTSFHIGGALGVAVASTVAASNADAMLVKPGQAPLSAMELTSGYRSAFVAAVTIAVVALLVALTLLRSHRAVPARSAVGDEGHAPEQ
jgi:EmrB/QacA subfamily drug resistance transporter